MSKPFAMDHSKDLKLVGKSFTIKGMGLDGNDVKAKFTGIDKDGRYEFTITSSNTAYEMFMTGVPNNGDVQ
jgi:hypothetical protein